MLRIFPAYAYARVQVCVYGPLNFARRSSQWRHAILIYLVERLESTIAALRVQGWIPESGPISRSRIALATPFSIRPEYGWQSIKTRGRK